jgi:hypothetical protein
MDQYSLCAVICISAKNRAFTLGEVYLRGLNENEAIEVEAKPNSRFSVTLKLISQS